LASAETSGTISSYLVERCQGAGCTSFAQIGTSVTTAFSDTGLGGGSYTYRVRAKDAAGNLSPYSNVASASIAAPPPTAPSNLTATAASVSQINLSWTASTSTIGIANYVVQRCQGAGCTNFAQIATPTGTTYNDTALISSTSYSYRVEAIDTAGTASTFSNVASATTLSPTGTIGYVQGNYATPQTPQTTVNVTFTAAQAAGDLNVVVVGWNDSTAVVNAVTDKSGNTYTRAVGPTVLSGSLSQSIYYAKNIASAAAGANIVTVTFSVAAVYPDIRILEYNGADPNNPVDVTGAGSGNSVTSSSAAATTTNPTDLIFGANMVESYTNGPGSGFTMRISTSPDGDIAEDQMVTATGSYRATAPVGMAGPWIMQMVAFRTPGSSGPPPISVSVSPSTASVSTGSGTQIFNAAVQNDLQRLGVTFSLSGAGCSGSACGSLSNVTATSVTYTAPVSVPNPPTVTLTATSVTDNTKTAKATITVTQGGSLNVTVSPKRAAVTLSQPQQFTATVQNDPQNLGVTWSVDGNNGGTALSGTISSAGLFTPGTQAGSHTVTATSNSNSSVSASVTIGVTELTGMFTYHYDSARTGQNLKEYALTPATLSSSTFGALFSCSVDSIIYATPLYVANLNIGGVKHNAVFVATEHDTVYAFDADSPSCQQLWKTSFLSAGVTTVPIADKGNSSDLPSEFGITGTPVIDPSTNTLYVIAHTKETVGSGCSATSPCYFYRLHALDLVTGIEKLGGPVVISAPSFIPVQQLQRPGLALNNSTVYVAFGSNDDIGTGVGWLMAFNATTLAHNWSWSAVVPQSGNNFGSIWGAGNAPAVDASGNIYVETGNGGFDGVSNFSDSVVKLSPTGSVLDYFTPFNQATLEVNDIDLGSSGPMILPDSVGSAAHPHLMIATGKVGTIYLLDQTNMGKYNTSSDQVVEKVVVVANTTNFNGGFFGQPAYWNGNIYGLVVGDSLRQYLISSGSITSVSNSNSSNTFTFRGATPAVSANGTSAGIVWVVDNAGFQSSGVAILYAYDATNLAKLLYSSPTSGAGAGPVSAKFTVPTVANGKVYVVGQNAFTVFGLLPN
jgi:fibronectin type 3 domain-containing protein